MPPRGGVDLGGVPGLPRPRDPDRRARDLGPEGQRPEQDVDVHRLEDELSFLGRDEAVFHRVGDPDRGVEPDDPRRPAARSGPRIKGSIISAEPMRPQGHQARRQRGGVALRLHAEQLQQEKPLRSLLMSSHAPQRREDPLLIEQADAPAHSRTGPPG
jgi:hypothetical protein